MPSLDKSHFRCSDTIIYPCIIFKLAVLAFVMFAWSVTFISRRRTSTASAFWGSSTSTISHVVTVRRSRSSVVSRRCCLCLEQSALPQHVTWSSSLPVWNSSRKLTFSHVPFPVYASAGYAQRRLLCYHYAPLPVPLFRCLSRCPVPTWIRPQGRRDRQVHYAHAALEASYDRERYLAL